ncbi:hypothetical protein TNCT_739271 [Trichonephila clavata]|uniref:Uncharacterized protein n=1 Tax=Trichonephila clavata TaxID=2740835 RepID=A0A8X6KAT3_TRICU|nr:hypothetical protein TNCT_739271 [Trichonephila clavata]
MTEGKAPKSFPLHLPEKTLKTLKGECEAQFSLFPGKRGPCEKVPQRSLEEMPGIGLPAICHVSQVILTTITTFKLVLIVCLHNPGVLVSPVAQS